MKHLTPVTVIVTMLVACGCSSTTAVPNSVYSSATPFLSKVSYDSPQQTVLLVSLDDGTVIKQMIDVAADICFKQVSSTATTCLAEGAPIIDSATNAVIGIEMLEKHIDLVGK